MIAVWFDDETLQKQEVYLPSLPAQYEPHRLAQVMQRHQVCSPGPRGVVTCSRGVATCSRGVATCSRDGVTRSRGGVTCSRGVVSALEAGLPALEAWSLL